MHLPEESSFTPAPAGAHTAICVAFIDMGTQPSFYEDAKPAHKVRITWELVDEFMDDGRPFTISKTYTWSMNDRATLRAHLESWRGRPFVKADFGEGGFDTRKLLGVGCTLTVQHKDVNGSLRAVVASVAPPMKGVKIGKPSSDPIYLSLDSRLFDVETYHKLGEKTRDAISQSPEYVALSSAKNGHANERMHSEELDDEIPF